MFYDFHWLGRPGLADILEQNWDDSASIRSCRRHRGSLQLACAEKKAGGDPNTIRDQIEEAGTRASQANARCWRSQLSKPQPADFDHGRQGPLATKLKSDHNIWRAVCAFQKYGYTLDPGYGYD